MISKFGKETALIVIDAQKGVNELKHWGGVNGRRNNPGCETHIMAMIDAWRAAGLPVIFTQHDSRQKVSPLKVGQPGGEFLDGITPVGEELVVRKDVNSGFIGTRLEVELRRRHITRLVCVGYFTNFCVETTVRMSGNLGFDTYLAHDACATSNRIDVHGVDHSPEMVHDLAVASMHGEFCTAMTHVQALNLLKADAMDMDRVQRNE
jgi:nicotinamidase-related amidase